MKKLLALALAALLIFALIGCNKDKEEATEEESEEIVTTNVYENFTYDVNENGELEITGYKNTSTELADVKIPAEIDERPIVGIRKEAFMAFKNIKSVTFPETITYIGDYAFADCDYLVKLELPKNLTTIGEGAFKSCDALANVSFPAALLSVGQGAFMDCTSLKNFTLPEGLLSIEDQAFWGCKKLTKVTIPTTVLDLGDAAFYGCTSLYEVNLLGDKKVDEADDEILAKINQIIAEAAQAPTTLAQVANILEEADYYLGGLTNRGAKFVWDKNENKVYGAMTAADATLVASINEALKNDASTTLDLMISNMQKQGFDPNQLNASVKSDKFVWDADKNAFITVYAGESVFAECTSNTIISVTEGSFFAEYVAEEELIFVVPANAPEGTKTFSDGLLAFYYPEALAFEVSEGIVSMTSKNILFSLYSMDRDLEDDHTLWTQDQFDEIIADTIFTEFYELMGSKKVEQLTNENGIKITKISFTVTEENNTDWVTLHIVTIGNTTYQILLIEENFAASLHTMIETSIDKVN